MKKIEGFNYSICENGKVYSHITNRFRTLGVNNKGYYSVILYDQAGANKQYLVHRLVAQYFIPNPLNLPCVNHKDGDKSNNHSSNLEWCTYSENNIHALDTGLRDTNRFKDVDIATKVITYAMDGWRQKDISVALGISIPMVRHYLYSDSFAFVREDFDWDNRPNKSSTISDETVVRICELLQEGFSVKKVAELTSVSHRKVLRLRNRETYKLISQNFNF